MFAVFYCQHPTARSIGWILNDVPFLQYSPPNATHTSRSAGVGKPSIHMLTMLAREEYNGTRIQCLAALESNISFAEPAAMLTVQGSMPHSRSWCIHMHLYLFYISGPLNAISSVSISFPSAEIVHLVWTPPFSLNLTTAEPDIVYCVDVYIVDTNMLTVSNCTVFQNSYVFKVENPGPRDQFQFIITPRNNVDGARNGTQSEPIIGFFPSNT